MVPGETKESEYSTWGWEELRPITTHRLKGVSEATEWLPELEKSA